MFSLTHVHKIPYNDKVKMYTLLFKSLGSLRNVSVFERKGPFWSIKIHQINQKYSVDIVNVVNDYCSWKQQIFYEIAT